MRLQINIAPGDAPGILAGLVEVNLHQLRRLGLTGTFPVLSGLRDGLIRYRKADPTEDWKPHDRLFKDKWGDCEDLAAAVAAEYMAAGVFARPVAYQPDPTDLRVWHVVVEVQDPETGAFWYGDPSILGGMKAA